MSHLLANAEIPTGCRPPAIVEGRETDLWVDGRKEGSNRGSRDGVPVAITRGKEMVETNPSSSNQPNQHEVDDDSVSGHHQIVATSSANRAAYVSEGSIDPILDQSLSNGAAVQPFEGVDVEITDDELVYEEEHDVVSSKPIVPFEGMEFDTIDEARRVYNAYAFKMGFSIRIGSSRSSRVTKQLIRKEFECSHARITPGEKEESASSNASSSAAATSKKKSAIAVMTTATRKRSTLKKADCKAHMAMGLRNGRWRVVVFQAEHTHPLVKIKGRVMQLRSHRRISWADYELLKTLHHRNISTMQIMAVLGDFHGGVGNLTFNSKDVSNMRTHLRAGLRYRDMDAVLEYIQKLQAESPSFFYAIKLDAENAVRGLFWVDGRSRELYKCFRDCIFFDTTFCTNRYNMPFAPIVGINNHAQSILLGCALLPDETTETFVWVLQTLKDAMGGIAPTNIMTDQDRAMKAAIAQMSLTIASTSSSLQRSLRRCGIT
ncbi:protein FAR-RED IMPAIRED RESPONSE 1 [Sorghum bicolor]|uniref:protein FAR-RED IMPAIRED RESPONSE 1 n=1 Tax=Sorghum bicolor TaxID=4558 RepID=UPI000B4258D0|nr:protein FAR-RED IMPAIRED RESPONSE 1 [Sorghum bicolor]|eukprot:XP_021304998.1 protein FAR-RED IMPAIRED RESPONSE 1 [Sorghum bicolor]